MANPSNPFVPEVEETGSVARSESARSVAEIQAAIFVARSLPRDRARALDLILQDCTDASLAQEAEYEYVRAGTKITGPSIRLMETIARRWGNFESGVRELARGADWSECEAYAWDIESNVRDRKIFRVRHWRDTRDGGYRVEDERDIYEVIANAAARRKRACMQAVIPAEIVNAAIEQARKTLSVQVEVTAQRISEMVAKFAELGVTREAIEARIQRHLSAISPALLMQLGRIYTSIRDGMSRPEDWFEVPSSQTGTEALKQLVKRRGTRRKAEQSAAEPQPQAASTDAATAGTAATAAGKPATEFSDENALAEIEKICKRAVQSRDRDFAFTLLDDGADLARSLSPALRARAEELLGGAVKALKEQMK